ncbi:uncharacterized protein [Amphiura filiformis]|uniref:uncharacterized protein n=1 Tax=Amphiura filiformis TaxID=82378 RepID=UPI003B20F907
MDREPIQFPTLDLVDPDAMLVCPFCNHDNILAMRYPYHIIKCRKNYNGCALVTCSFNARHKEPASTILHHLATCPDKKCVEPDIAYQQRKLYGCQENDNFFKGCTELPNYAKIPPPIEDWDAECSDEDCTGYNPDAHPRPPAYNNITSANAQPSQRDKPVQAYWHYTYDSTANSLDQSANSATISLDQSANSATISLDQSANSATNSLDQSANSATIKPVEQLQNTASKADEQISARLPRQPAKAAAIALGSGNVQQSAFTRPKKGGHIAANISGKNDTASRPWVGIGRGAVTSGQRGYVPGIGRGLIKSDAITMPGLIKK